MIKFIANISRQTDGISLAQQLYFTTTIHIYPSASAILYHNYLVTEITTIYSVDCRCSLLSCLAYLPNILLQLHICLYTQHKISSQNNNIKAINLRLIQHSRGIRLTWDIYVLKNGSLLLVNYISG